MSVRANGIQLALAEELLILGMHARPKNTEV